MIKFLESIYKPFLFARYSLFLKSNKNSKRTFSINEEYGTLSFLNIITPIWLEVTLMLIFANIVPIVYNTRLIIIGICIIINYTISKLIIQHLKKNEFVTETIKEFNVTEDITAKYNSFLYCLFLLCLYAVLPFIPIVLYYVI